MKYPPPPDPFAPLPICPPGMLQNAAGLPATPADVPADYPLRISWPGILVDDPGHPEDIVGRMREALAVIWPNARRHRTGSVPILGVARCATISTTPTASSLTISSATPRAGVRRPSTGR